MKLSLKPVLVGMWLVGLILFTACGPNEQARPSNPEILATYRGGEISIDDLDDAILSLPEPARQVREEEALERDRSLVEVLVVNRLLLESAASEGVREKPEFVLLHEDNRQRIVAEHFIRQEISRMDGVTEADARAYFDQHQEDFKQPASRMTLHIFRRVNDGGDFESETREMQGLRERIIGGESFGELARRYSDSESAQRGGELGWITEANAPGDLAAVVFGLEPLVPSEPVVTAEGIHLFMVTQESADRSYTFDEVESQVAAVLSTRDRRAFTEEMVADLPLPEPYFVAEVEEMGYLLGGGDPEVEVFQVGESSLSVGQFRHLVDRAIAAPGTKPTPNLPETLLTALVNRARIYEYCRSQGVFEQPALRARLESVADADLVDYMRERGLRNEARLDATAIGAYFEANSRRFSSPLILDAEVLVVPIPDRGSNEMMDRLSRLDHDPAVDRLEAAASALGGEVGRVEAVTLDQFRRWNQKVGAIVSALEVGRCSPPVRVGDSVVVVELERRLEPEPQPFATVADEVVWSYLSDHQREVYDRWSGKLLDEAGFRVFDDRLEAFWRGEREGGLEGGPAVPLEAPSS